MKTAGTALVTGAGRGLGREIALELARRGFDVIAGVRDFAAGEELVRAAAELAGTVQLQRLDLRELGSYVPPADLRVLVNNAGFRGRYLPIEEADMEEWRKIFETNFFGLLDLTRRCIPKLREAGNGIICNINSCGVFTPLPFYSSYRCSKAALAALSEGLKVELAPFGIRVVEIPIGGVVTDMMKDSIAVRPPEAIAYEFYQPMAVRLQSIAQSGMSNGISPDEAAFNVVDAMLDDKGPLRRPCDPNAHSILAQVENSTDEGRLSAMLERLDFTD